jgi:hypothetical protein
MRRSNRIVLAKAVGFGAEHDAESIVSATFAIQDVLKGPVGTILTLHGLFDPHFSDGNPLPDFPRPNTPPDFDGHRDWRFWAPTNGRISGSCRMQPNFELGKTYLLFPGADHVKAYERIATADDLWLTAVQRLIAQPNLKHGRVMSPHVFGPDPKRDGDYCEPGRFFVALGDRFRIPAFQPFVLIDADGLVATELREQAFIDVRESAVYQFDLEGPSKITLATLRTLVHSKDRATAPSDASRGR